MAVSAPLAREKALEMQEALLAEYGKAAFQAKLRFVLQDSCTTAERLKVERQLRELRENVGARFGFAASPEGVAKSAELFTPRLLADPDVARNCRMMNILLYPQLQDELAERRQTASVSFRRQAEIAAQCEAEKMARKKASMEKMSKTNKPCMKEEVGRKWTVIGGCKKGILVRRGEDLGSAPIQIRLANNSVIEELELVADRLHYRKLVGEGPDFGWVSLTVKGTTLLEPVPGDELGVLSVPAVWGIA